MTIEEKIEQEKRNIKIQERYSKLCEKVGLESENAYYKKQIEESEQIIAWLEELKQYRIQELTPLKDFDK